MEDQRLNKIQEDITKILVVLERNTTNLAEHMRRTTALESVVEILKKDTVDLQKQSATLNVIWKVALAFGGCILALNQLAALVTKIN